MEVLSAKEMAKVDALTIAHDLSGEILMERAGQGAALEILSFLEHFHPRHRRRLVIVCGKGNNAGDGYVIARALCDKIELVVWSLFPISDLKGDAFLNAQRLPKVVQNFGEVELQEGDIIIDCLLGTGLQSDVREPFVTAIKYINQSELPTVSIDMASGLNGTTGLAQGTTVIADLTLCIGRPKLGNFYQDGPEYSGRLRCIDIGFPQKYFDQIESKERAVFEQDIHDHFHRRKSSVHKYQCGNVVVLGGSPSYLGAPSLAAAMAQRAGCGMVTMILPTQVGQVIERRHDSLIVDKVISQDGYWQEEHWQEVQNKFKKKPTLVIGPGFAGEHSEKSFLSKVLTYQGKLVIDAGAIALLDPRLLVERMAPTVLTPHLGEFKALVERVNLCQGVSMLEQAEFLAKEFKLHIVLKGQYSQIFFPDGSRSRNSSGSAALATAGSGDVLAGLIGAFLSETDDVQGAVETAVFIHGRAGEQSHLGDRALIADDLIELVPEVIQQLTPWA